MAHEVLTLMRRWSFILVFVVALTARLVGNTQVPSSPYWEETALGFDAYSLLKTGKDHHGEAWPMAAFTSFGDYKPSLYFYATLPSVALFGLNVFAVRFPAALASALTVALLFWLAKRWRSERFGILTMVLATFQPWMWHLGRLGFEVNLGMMLSILGVVCIQKGYDSQNKKMQMMAMGCATTAFVAAMYAYHGTRLLAPLFALAGAASLWDWPKKLHFNEIRKWLLFWIPSGILAHILALPLLIALHSPVIAQRFQETSIFGTGIAPQLSTEMKAIDPNNVALKIIYHPQVIWLSILAQNYLNHFDPGWLFLRGDYNPRHSSQYLGMLYPWEFFTILFGIAYASKLLKKKHFWLLISMTLISPLAAMVTTGTPHGLRALPLAPVLALWSALGAEILFFEILPQLCKKIPVFKRRNVWAGIFTLLLLGSFSALAYYMTTQYQVRTATEWQYGYKEIIVALRKHQMNNEPLHLSRAYGRPAMYLWFTEKTDPTRVQAQESLAKMDQKEFLTFEEWTFFDGQWLGGGLAAAPEALLPEGRTVLETIAITPGKNWFIYR